jgi:hypothetical protein
VTPATEVEIAVNRLGPELELELDEDEVEVVEMKSEAWYRIETP